MPRGVSGLGEVLLRARLLHDGSAMGMQKPLMARAGSAAVRTEQTSRQPSSTSLSSVAGFHHVLVCLDRSEAAEVVLPIASHVAKVDRARMTLVHVLNAQRDDEDIRVTDALEWDIARQEASSYLNGLVERAGGFGVEAESRVTEGSAAHRVASLTAELDADLIVISTFGAGGAEPWNLGGTAQKILAIARGAVLVVPAAAGTSEPVFRVPPHRLLVPLDGSVRSECVLPAALRLAQASDAEIVVAHIVANPTRTEVLSTDEDVALAQELADRLASRADAYLERVRSNLSAAGARVRASVCRSADHREGLIALSAAEHADLIVLSAHGAQCNPRRRFGSVASYVLSHSAVPVLVIQDLPGSVGQPVASRASRLPPRSVDGTFGGQ